MRVRRVLGITFAATVLIATCTLALGFCQPTGTSSFDSPAGEQAYRAAYAAAMTRLPPPLRTVDVETDFGTVRVYEFGKRGAAGEAPILLLPGRSSGVPMWAANLPGLAAERTVLAIDVLGDAGRSVQRRPLVDADEQAAWLEQTLQKLGVRRVHLVGHSFGGWLAANYALRHPDRVATLALLEPVLVFAGLRWQFIAATIPASLKFLPASMREWGLRYIGGDQGSPDPDDPVARMIELAAARHTARLPLPAQPTDEELRRLSMPVYVAIAGRTVVHDPVAALTRAKALLPHGVGRMWPAGTHSLPLEFPREVNRELLSFIARAGR